MINRKFFFDNARLQLFNGRLTTKQVEGLSAILDEWEKNHSEKDDRWLAYMFATAHHETDRKMQPIEEYGKGIGFPYGKRLKMTRDRSGKRIPYTDTNQIFYGRGFVQLTWYENYKKAGDKLGQDFLHDAAKVMVLPNAVKILFLGMMEGWFTGKKLSDYFFGITENWLSARRIINGTDKADLIKSHALKYYSCISYTV
jgi:putative chitinase